MVYMLFLFNMLRWWGDDVDVPEVSGDSTAALATANRIGAGKRMKHIDTQMFYVQGLVQDLHRSHTS